MISLPIIFREFRVAARKKPTFVLRCVFAGLLTVVLLFFFQGQGKFFGVASTALGKTLLHIFSWQLLILVFAVAPAVTSGCISDERREGTLGLLFLTHLNAADIVLGKFVSKGIDLLLMVLAASPLLFAPILLGGVNWDQTLSVLVNVLALLLLASAFGVFCSAASKNTMTATAVAYLLLIFYNVVAVVLPVLKREVLAHHPSSAWGLVPDWLLQASPFYTLSRLDLPESWTCLLCCAVCSAAVLGYAIWRLPAVVRTEPFREPFWRRFARQTNRVPERGQRRYAPVPAHANPVAWLHFGRSGSRWVFQWIVVAALSMTTAYAVSARWVPRYDLEGFFITVSLIGLFGLKFLMVLHVARAFATEKADGALELLLVAPLSSEQIVRGRIRAVVSRYALIWLLLFGALGAGFFFTGHSSWSSENLLAMFYLLTTTVSSLAWAIPFAALISTKAKSVKQAITNSVIGIMLLIWLVNVVTWLGWIFIVSKMSHHTQGELVVTCVTVGRLVAEFATAAVCYRMLVENLRAYATR